jgi:hypothetical protein
MSISSANTIDKVFVYKRENITTVSHAHTKKRRRLSSKRINCFLLILSIQHNYHHFLLIYIHRRNKKKLDSFYITMYMYRYEKRVKYYGHIENNEEIGEC